ncbi:MAG TPA: hypothetical protein VL171_01465 [Verrucomicrobiae bacterium]|nr:hypothetical protein [Verrucomicrobiae bacterium]
MTTEPKEPKQKRVRSPSYPGIDLEESLNRARILWEKVNRHPVSVDVAARYWELAPQGSQALVTIAALKKFGLAEESESTAGREIKLTDLAISLVYNPDVGSPEYKALLAQAALSPQIHDELWQKYQGTLPDDKLIERYLVIERKFNQKYVSQFISEFRRTIEFAKLRNFDKVPATSSLKVNQATEKTESRPTLKFVPGYIGGGGKAHEATDSNISEVPIFLDEDKYAKVPFPLTEEDYQLLLEQLRLLKKRLVPKAK